MWAMPTTRVENTSGAMIIRIRRRKTSVTRPKFAAQALAVSALGAASWQMAPVMMPRTMAARTTSVKRRRMMPPNPTERHR